VKCACLQELYCVSLIYRDRIRQKASASGTGNVQLGAAVPSYLTFAQASLSSNSFPYAIINSNQFEVGIGTFDGTYLYRNIVLSTSNADQSLVNFDGTLGDVIITNASELSVLTSTQPTANSNKFVKWVNSQFLLVDPVENPQIGMQSSVVFYNYSNAAFDADPNFKYYPGNLPEVYVNGVIQATAKSFKIPHPNKDGWLIHGSLEGPEHGIYLRGSAKINKYCRSTSIILPDYFTSLSDNYTITISSDSFIPIKFEKDKYEIKFKTLFPSMKDTEINYLIIAKRNDVKFKLEE
jgi:hypothetical protein